VTVTGALVVLFPAASCATLVNEYEPFATALVSQM
jgi:hypothetical protein